MHHSVTLLLQVADGFLRRGMRVACRRGNHRHITFNAVDHHHRAVEPQRQRLSGLPLRFNQIHIINFGDAVTSFFNAHRTVAVVHGCHPSHLGFVTLPVVDALPALFAQPPCQHQLLLDQRRQKTTLLPEGVKYRAGHRKVHVLTNHVGQLQRPHREAAAFAQGGVNHLRRRDLLFQRAPGLGIERTGDAVDDEPRRGLAANGLFAPVQRQLAQRVGHFRRGRQPADHLHQLHHRRRVEEMQSGDPLRVVDVRRNRRNGDGRGIAGQHCLRRADLSQLCKQRLFHLQTLGGRFYDQIGRGERLDIRDRKQPGEDLAPGIGGEFSARHPGGQTLADPVDGPRYRVAGDVVDQHLMPMAGRDFGNPCAHRAAANHGDSPYVQHLISP